MEKPKNWMDVENMYFDIFFRLFFTNRSICLEVSKKIHIFALIEYHKCARYPRTFQKLITLT